MVDGPSFSPVRRIESGEGTSVAGATSDVMIEATSEERGQSGLACRSSKMAASGLASVQTASDDLGDEMGWILLKNRHQPNQATHILMAHFDAHLRDSLNQLCFILVTAKTLMKGEVPAPLANEDGLIHH